MLWIKSFHIIFVICWFAGIFYLPRLFVNHAMASHPDTAAQLLMMERKLYRFITPFAFLAVGFGIWLMAMNLHFYLSQPWFLAKVALVILLAIYHLQCGRYITRFEAGVTPNSHTFYRWFNEIPVFMLFGIVILVVVRPFS